MTTMIDFVDDTANDPTYVPEVNRLGIYPSMYWKRGSKQPARPGFAYVTAKTLGCELSAPFVAVDDVHDEDGYTADAFNALWIGVRSTPFYTVEDGYNRDGSARTRKVWVKHFKKDANPRHSFCTEVLMVVDGSPTPLVFVVNGLNGKYTQDAYAEFRKFVLDPAGKLKGAPVAPWTFWMPFVQMLDAKGKAIAVPAGPSFVTPPALAIKAELDRAGLNNILASKEDREYAADLHAKHADWFKTNRYWEAVERGDIEDTPNGKAAPAAPTAVLPAWGEDDLPPDE